MFFLGVDVGGTLTKVGIVDDEGVVVKRCQFATPNNYQSLINQIYVSGLGLCSNTQIDLQSLGGVGVGVPGIIDATAGTIINCPVLKLKNKQITKDLAKQFKLPVKIKNDANLMAVGEHKFGVCKNIDNIVYLTLGTGIGGGIIANGNLIEGLGGLAGEVGHMIIELNGHKCNCGSKGCFQTYASASALLRDAKKQLDEKSLAIKLCNDKNLITPQNIFDAYKSNDKQCVALVEKYVENLCVGIVNLLNLLRPQAIVIGGGLSHFEDVLKPLIEKNLQANNFGYLGAPKSEILFSTLKSNAGIAGSVTLFKKIK